MSKRTIVLLVVVALVMTMVGATAGASEEKALKCFGRSPTHVGTNGPDTIFGTAGSDVIIAKNGNDTIHGGGGNDFICAGKGHDTVHGNAGKDRIKGQGGNDTLYGDNGNDKLIGNAGADTLWGGNGRDLLKGGGGNDWLYGEGGNDDLRGQGGNDWLDGSPGTLDTNNGGAGTDTCFAGDWLSINCEGGGGGGGNTLNTGLPATYGSPNLASGFLPDPWKKNGTSGGSIDVSYLGWPASSPESCRGWAAEAPDFELTWSGGGTLLRMYFVANTVGNDTTLVINDPVGNWHCVDDFNPPGRNPSIDFNFPLNGVYDIWIASYSQGDFHSGKFYITEKNWCDPSNPC